MKDKYDDAGILILPTVKLELIMDIEYIKNCLLNNSASAVRDELLVFVEERDVARIRMGEMAAEIERH